MMPGQGCKDDEISSQDILGNWGRDINGTYFIIKFREGGKIAFEKGNIKDDNFGRYELMDNIIAISDLSCGSTEIGEYSYNIANNQLFFELITDTCHDRIQVLVGGAWERL